MSGWIKVKDKTPPVGKNVKVCIESDDGMRHINDGTYQDGEQLDSYADAVFYADDLDEVIPEGWYELRFMDCGWGHYDKLGDDEKVTHWAEPPKLSLPETEEDSGLAHCPFCGSTDIEIESYHLRFWGKCRNCLAEGPPTTSEEEATELWNRRTTDDRT